MSIDVVGIGDDGLGGLPPAARALIASAEVLVGGARHLEMIEPGPAQRLVWPTPFGAARAMLDAVRDARTVVLATGDPLWFGVGNTLIDWFGASEVRCHPHPGAFSLAASHLGWALQDVTCLSVHGRNPALLLPHLAPGRRLLVLANDGGSAGLVAATLSGAGYGASHMVALSHLRGAGQSVIQARAAQWVGQTPALTVLALDLAADAGARIVPPGPGLPDDLFETDGQLTKQAIRAVTLARLAPWPGALLWDVGAGSGSVAIEWMRAGGRAVAIESEPARAARIARNALALGVPDLDIREGTAPSALPDGQAPDAVFVGGGVAVPGLLEICWNRVRPGGRMVVNAVTLEGEAALIGFYQTHGGEMTRIAVTHLAPIGGFHGWHPARPVTQYVGEKS